MKNQTFEQKRIVELSKDLDSERDKNVKLIRQTIFLNNKLKQVETEVEQEKQKIIQFQIQNHKLTQKYRQIAAENNKLKDEIEEETKLRSTAEVENVRQRQKIDQLKNEMLNYENNSKAILYQKTAEMAEKDKEIYRLKQENIEIEKLYLNKREQHHKKEEKRMRQLAKVFQELEDLKKQINNFKIATQKSINTERNRLKKEVDEINAKIAEIERRIRRQQQMQKQIDEMKQKIEDVVIQNSQKIIQLYKYKYG